jgi:hypothetical protein
MVKCYLPFMRHLFDKMRLAHDYMAMIRKVRLHFPMLFSSNRNRSKSAVRNSEILLEIGVKVLLEIVKYC